MIVFGKHTCEQHILELLGKSFGFVFLRKTRLCCMSAWAEWAAFIASNSLYGTLLGQECNTAGSAFPAGGTGSGQPAVSVTANHDTPVLVRPYN